MTSIADCTLIDLPRVLDPRGALSFIEGGRHVPLQIARVHYLHNVPGGGERGGHAQKELQKGHVAMAHRSTALFPPEASQL